MSSSGCLADWILFAFVCLVRVSFSVAQAPECQVELHLHSFGHFCIVLAVIRWTQKYCNIPHYAGSCAFGMSHVLAGLTVDSDARSELGFGM